MSKIKKLIPKETTDTLEIIGKILPSVPMVNGIGDGMSYEWRKKEVNGEQRLVMVMHYEELANMYRKGGWGMVHKYIEAIYQVADAFYGVHGLFHRLIPYKEMANSELDLHISAEFKEGEEYFRTICGEKIRQPNRDKYGNPTEVLGSNRERVRLHFNL